MFLTLALAVGLGQAARMTFKQTMSLNQTKEAVVLAYDKADIYKIEFCLHATGSYAGGSSGSHSVKKHLCKGTESSRALDTQQSFSVKANAKAAYTNGFARASASVSTTFSRAVQSAIRDSETTMTCKDEEFVVDFSKPCYLYQGVVTITLMDHTIIEKKSPLIIQENQPRNDPCKEVRVSDNTVKHLSHVWLKTKDWNELYLEGCGRKCAGYGIVAKSGQTQTHTRFRIERKAFYAEGPITAGDTIYLRLPSLSDHYVEACSRTCHGYGVSTRASKTKEAEWKIFKVDGSTGPIMHDDLVFFQGLSDHYMEVCNHECGGLGVSTNSVLDDNGKWIISLK